MVTITGYKHLSHYRETYIRDGYVCQYCGKDLKGTFDDWMNLEIDHLIPLSKGGNESLGNTVTACNVCNRLKGRYVPENHANMSQEDIFKTVKARIQERRSKWLAKYKQAMAAFERDNNQ